MKECCKERIAASISTLRTIGSVAVSRLLAQLPSLLRVIGCATRTKLLAIRPSVASAPDWRRTLPSLDRLDNTPPSVGRTITSLAAAIVIDWLYVPLT